MKRLAFVASLPLVGLFVIDLANCGSVAATADGGALDSASPADAAQDGTVTAPDATVPEADAGADARPDVAVPLDAGLDGPISCTAAGADAGFCPDIPPTCTSDGTAVANWSGTCEDGGCTYTATLVPCTSGGSCYGGKCIVVIR